MVEGTVRCLDDEAWHAAPDMVKALVDSVATSYGVVPEIIYQRNVPPTVNDAVCTAMIEAAADRVLGPDAVTPAPQSLGGEDFAWYLESIPGALARLGTRTPGRPTTSTSTRPRSTWTSGPSAIGVRLMAATALTAMGGSGPPLPVPLQGTALA